MTSGPTTAAGAPPAGSSDDAMPPLEEVNTTPRMDRLEGGGAAGLPESPSERTAHNSGVESLAWRDLSYYYRVKEGKGQAAGERAAVTRCTGLVKRGDMVAVMGEPVVGGLGLGWELGGAIRGWF